MPEIATLPPRIDAGSAPRLLAHLGAAGLIAWSLAAVGASPRDLFEGLPHMARLAGEMSPPSLERLDAVLRVLLETAHMAVAGAAVGVFASLFLGILAARSQTPHRVLYHASRSVIALFRTVPDLVWAVFFVASVGLGPFAGMLTIAVDTMGFCGRFFAEAMEEADRGPQEALAAAGAGRMAIVLAAVLPATLPSLVGTALFALEKAVRSSVVLGLVGAGGIGIELKVAMDLFQYREAATIILCIFALVLGVERLSSEIRRRIL